MTETITFGCWLDIKFKQSPTKKKIQLARALDADPSAITMMLQDKRNPQTDEYDTIAHFFGVDLEEVAIAAGRKITLEQAKSGIQNNTPHLASSNATPFKQDVYERTIKLVDEALGDLNYKASPKQFSEWVGEFYPAVYEDMEKGSEPSSSVIKMVLGKAV